MPNLVYFYTQLCFVFMDCDCEGTFRSYLTLNSACRQGLIAGWPRYVVTKTRVSLRGRRAQEEKLQTAAASRETMEAVSNRATGRPSGWVIPPD